MAANKLHKHIYRDQAGEWRWSLVFGNNIIADSGEGYKNRKDCEAEFGNLGLRFYEVYGKEWIEAAPVRKKKISKKKK